MAEVPAAGIQSDSTDDTKVIEKLYTPLQISTHFSTVLTSGTLAASTSTPELLARILIFRNQHPHHPPKIFVKTNLHLLSTLEPVPIFIGDKSAFQFGGWVKIVQVERLEQGSDELVGMLTEKWKCGKLRRGKEVGREEESEGKAFSKSLEVDWAVVKLEMVEDITENPMKLPAVQKEPLQKERQVDDVEENSRPTTAIALDSTTPTKSHSYATPSGLTMTKPSSSPSSTLSPSIEAIHRPDSSISSSLSSLAPSDAPDHDRNYEYKTDGAFSMEESMAMVDDLGSMSISGTSDYEEGIDDEDDEESDRWSELSGGNVNKDWELVT